MLLDILDNCISSFMEQEFADKYHMTVPYVRRVRLRIDVRALTLAGRFSDISYPEDLWD